jgi:glucose-1-phosphate cytidylyltransferase
LPGLSPLGFRFVHPPGPIAILCGGRGTRLREHAESIPKALVEVGGRPILWHVIGIHAAQGFEEFVLCTGYKGDQIADWVGSEPWPERVDVRCLETGLDTPTGGRTLLAAHELGGRPFNLAYADGVADVDLGAMLESHRSGGKLATMAVVRPRLGFGVAEIDRFGMVLGFEEKPLLERWINGGFFRFEPEVVGYLEPDSVLEREPLERLAADGGLRAYRHHGFWDCMDTYKDAVVLNDLWASGDPPWSVWEPDLERA